MELELDEDERWTVQRSADLYQIKGWGQPYFRINAAGRVEVAPDPTRPDACVDLYALTQDLEARGLDLPLLIRFSDVLQDRIRRLNQCFERAIREYEYEGIYRGVFPVKVNQQRHLIDEVVEHGRPWRYGLEAGSKPELLIALAASDRGGLIICNGYKDRAYLETALLAQRFDKTVIVVLERIEELKFALEAAEKTGIRPALGVRAKLSAKGVGRWKGSAGDRAKFGLTAAEIVRVVDTLAERDMLDCLQLLHFHIGSQVSSIIPFKNALREAANIYVELVKMGAKMGYLDVGGGLAVDYDGSKTDYHASKNYDEQEYAYDVVGAVKEGCEKAGIAMPTLVSESGRAISAHQSVLVMEVVGTNEVRFGGQPEAPSEDAHSVLHGLYETWKGILPKNIQESYHDAVQGKEEAESLFKFGYLTLRQRAQAERLFWHCCEKIMANRSRLRRVPEEIQDLEDIMADIYYCNFSVFQSAPDMWAIEQLFPVMPIHRLDEEPTTRATIADLTCDSDGKIDRFIDVEDVKHALELHPVANGERYFLGLFLNGAYQEILGDLHNLFGDTNAVHVRVTDDGGYEVSSVVKGDSVREVLGYVEYDPEEMVERVRLQAERAQRAGLITIEQVRLLMRHYDDALRSYTYLTSE